MYAGSGFHRVIPSFMLQDGDFTNHDGTGGVSIYGAKFKDENFQLKAQANQARAALHGQRGPQHQFFIPAVVTSCLEGKHVVFSEASRITTSSRRSRATARPPRQAVQENHDHSVRYCRVGEFV
ncbi:cyclophilin-like domain-containing protein [Mycena galericulata]|nr:cyclophilin-like domain-containing protein [Mycena galericulata]